MSLLKKQIRNHGQIPYHFNWQSTCTDLCLTCKGLSFKLSNQRFFHPFLSSSVLAKIDQQIWSKPFVVSSSIRCISQELQWKERWIFHSFFHHFLRTSNFLCYGVSTKKKRLPNDQGGREATSLTRKQIVRYDCVCLRMSFYLSTMFFFNHETTLWGFLIFATFSKSKDLRILLIFTDFVSFEKLEQ